MALGSLRWLPLLLLLQGKMTSLELSCSAGPGQAVLEPNHALMLDCSLGVADQPRNITWRKDGALLVEQEHLRMLPNGSLIITQSRQDNEQVEMPGSQGSYSCTSHTALGAVRSRTVLVRPAVLSQFLQHPEPQSATENRTVRFQCRIEGLPAPSITWERNRKAVPVEPRFLVFPNGVLQIGNVQEDDAGSYRCLAANAVHARHSNEARLTVIKGSQPVTKDVTIVAAPQNTTVVAGQSAVLECVAAANPTPLVSWIRQDGEPISMDVIVLGEANLLIPDTQPHHSGVYVCRANKPAPDTLSQQKPSCEFLYPETDLPHQSQPRPGLSVGRKASRPPASRG
ncbi:immunoglobulin superfamily DCC subclass member 4-like [Rhinatrema bivittatum]|uniref:immunoglobulin superfamily DCC subclass member 4-like n=1 Tax=Rhinatrema bivittatum TaxID=194408 RepID=UPI001128C82C|nr:immunoglobulin superfamily DCC subclass member 4-like [Rhinatrema bivittatum]